jgi:hypothetical protein
VSVELSDRDVVRLATDGFEKAAENGAGRFTHVRKPTTDNHLVTRDVQFPDLTGKAAVVAGGGPALVAIVADLAANHCLVAIVSADRDVVGAATASAEAVGVPVLGMTADPAADATWDRITQHIEQRLGPIDIAVAVGSAAVHHALRRALARDMTARHRGVLIAVGSDDAAAELGSGVRHVVLAAKDFAAVAREASDVAHED